MEKKMQFEQPVVEIIQLNSEDIITTSGRFGAYWAGDEEEELIY